MNFLFNLKTYCNSSLNKNLLPQKDFNAEVLEIEAHYKMMKGTFHQEYLIILKLYIFYSVSKYIMQKLTYLEQLTG